MNQVHADASGERGLQLTGIYHARQRTDFDTLDRAVHDKISTTQTNSVVDVVLVDVVAPASHTALLVRQINLSNPRSAIIAIVDNLGDPEVSMLRQAGVTAFLPKTDSAAELFHLAQINSCSLDGNLRTPIEGGVKKLAGQRKNDCLDPLTRREMEILKAVASGQSNQEIAAGFGLSEQTVKTHLKSVFAKLGCRSRTAAIVAGVRKGWVSVRDMICGSEACSSEDLRWGYVQTPNMALWLNAASSPGSLSVVLGMASGTALRKGDSALQHLLHEIDQAI